MPPARYQKGQRAKDRTHEIAPAGEYRSCHVCGRSVTVHTHVAAPAEAEHKHRAQPCDRTATLALRTRPPSTQALEESQQHCSQEPRPGNVPHAQQAPRAKYVVTYSQERTLHEHRHLDHHCAWRRSCPHCPAQLPHLYPLPFPLVLPTEGTSPVSSRAGPGPESAAPWLVLELSLEPPAVRQWPPCVPRRVWAGRACRPGVAGP